MENCNNTNLDPTNVHSSLNNDNCFMDLQKKQSSGPVNYLLTSFNNCNCKNFKDVAINRPGHSAVQFRDGYGLNICNINNDSNLRKKPTNLKCIYQLIERPHLTTPYLGRGAVDKVTETAIICGEDTFQNKPCNLTGKDMTSYNMTPLISCLKNNIQNEKHIIEENNGWVRSGVPSRQIIRNKDYLQKCGFKVYTFKDRILNKKNFKR